MLLAFVTVFLACLGACIGSFLNVVIYRLPRGMSVAEPRRSFCPVCRRQIQWYYNIPVLSWIALRGRCRDCRVPISLQYPLVETAGVIVTMIVWQAARAYCTGLAVDACWPMIVGLLCLFYCLLALSAMDLKEYYVDIRLTWLALLVGLICHAISPAAVWPAGEYSSPAWAALAMGCLVALMVMHWLWPLPQEEPLDMAADEDGPQADSPQPVDPSASATAGASQPIWFVVLLAVATAGVVIGELVLGELVGGDLTAQVTVGVGFAVLFAAILAGSWIATDVDAAIAEAVEAERSMAMWQAVRETVILAVCIATGVGLMWLVQPGRPFSGVWMSALSWSPMEGVWPVAGLMTALTGWIIAGGICWAMRVFFTLVLRKEALGFGDIHIIAAVGAVLGPHLAVAGFFLAAPVALLGTAILMFRKSYRTLPFGPWLSIGFLLAALWGRPLVQRIDQAMAGLAAAMGR